MLGDPNLFNETEYGEVIAQQLPGAVVAVRKVLHTKRDIVEFQIIITVTYTSSVAPETNSSKLLERVLQTTNSTSVSEYLEQHNTTITAISADVSVSTPTTSTTSRASVASTASGGTTDANVSGAARSTIYVYIFVVVCISFVIL